MRLALLNVFFLFISSSLFVNGNQESSTKLKAVIIVGSERVTIELTPCLADFFSSHQILNMNNQINFDLNLISI